VVFFDVASLVVLVTHGDRGGVPGALVSLLLTGPLVAVMLLSAPILILAYNVKSWVWIALAELAIAPLAVAVLVSVEVDSERHSTAGIGLILIPLFGSGIAGLAWLADMMHRRWSRRSSE